MAYSSEYEVPKVAWGFDLAKSKFEQKFNEISDLIYEFNIHGFHDVCNVLTYSNVTYSNYLSPLFDIKNATGKFNESILIIILLYYKLNVTL